MCQKCERRFQEVQNQQWEFLVLPDNKECFQEQDNEEEPPALRAAGRSCEIEVVPQTAWLIGRMGFMIAPAMGFALLF